MTGSSTHTGGGAGEAVRKGVGLVHGTGEALRGNFNALVDGAAGDRAGVQKNEAIAARGTDEMDHGYHHDRGTGAGVTPVDTAAERQHRNVQGEFTHNTGSTNYGPHTTNVGNKVDPRVDSDLDGRGVHPTHAYAGPFNMYDGSSNYGPHSTHVGNKLDPRIDSDLDHRGAPGSSNYGPHSTNIGNKLDPRVDSDLDHRGLGYPEYQSSNYGPHHSNIANKLDPRVDSDLDHRGAGYGGNHSTNYGPHRSNAANKLEPRYDSDLDHRGQGTHYSDLGTAGFEQASRDMMQSSVREHAHSAGTDVDNTQHSNSHGHHSSSIGHGPHISRIANVLDPRIESKTDPCSEVSKGFRDYPTGSIPYRPAPPHRRRSEPLQYYGSNWAAANDVEAARQAHWQPLPLLPPHPYTPYPSPHLYYGYEYKHAYPYTYKDAYSSEHISPPADHSKTHAQQQPHDQSKALHAPHSNRIMNVLDPRTPMLAPKGKPHSNPYPHKSGWLNLLDPRVNRTAVRKEGG